MILYDYQKEALARTRQAFGSGKRAVLLVSPTGSGKTVIASQVVSGALERGNRVLFVAHRGELIEQTSRKLAEIGVPHGVMQQQHWRTDPRKPVQVATIQTLIRRDYPPARVVIFDEAHLSLSQSFVDVAEHYAKENNAIILGLTATPVRLDGKGLGRLYQEMIEVTTPARLIADGRLAKPRHFAPYVPELSDVHLSGGEYEAADLELIMAQQSLVGDIVDQWLKVANGRQTVVFSCSVRHSKLIAERFRAAGIPAEHVDGETPAFQRERAYERVRSRESLVLCNCAVLCEGFDLPAISAVVLARPTKSLGLYLQQVGRGLRASPGKTDCIILDHAGCGMAYGFVDDEREWTLEDRKKRGAKKAPSAPPLVACKQCFTLFAKSDGACPQCGWRPEQSQRKPIEQTDGELVELTEEDRRRLSAQKRAENRQAQTIDELIAIGKSRNYRYPVAWARKMIQLRSNRAGA